MHTDGDTIQLCMHIVKFKQQVAIMLHGVSRLGQVSAVGDFDANFEVVWNSPVGGA